MYKWFMTWRYLHTRLIAIFAMLGVTLCVAMVLVVLSVMGGFLDTIRERARGLLSDIVVDAATLQGWPYYEEFADYLLAELPDEVNACTPVIYNYGIFRVPRTLYTKTARVVGIKLDEYRTINDFGQGLHYDKYFPGTTHLGEQRQPMVAVNDNLQLVLPDELRRANRKWRESETDPEEIAKFDDLPLVLTPFIGPRVFERAESGEAGYVGELFPGAIIGSDLINERRSDGGLDRIYPRGERMAITILPLTQRGNISETPVSMGVRYADDSRTGVYEIDSMSVYVDFDLLQHQLAMDPQELAEGGFTKKRATQLLVSLQDGVDMNEARERIRVIWQDFLDHLYAEGQPKVTLDDGRLLNFVTVQTWEDLQRAFIAAVEKEKVLVTILFGLISFVAVVLIGCIFYMIVQKKTRDIGVFKSLGASGIGITTLFVSYGAAVGILGSSLGTGIGATFVWYINDIQAFLVSIHPDLRVWDPEIYSFDTIPNVVKMYDVVWVGLVAVFSSMLGSLIPAILAGRIWPADALRYE